MRVCAVSNVLMPAAAHIVLPPDHFIRPQCDISWRHVIHPKIPLWWDKWVMNCQRVAIAHLPAGTVWTTWSWFSGTLSSIHLIPVQLSLGALVADPMHQLSAAKGDVLGMNVVLGVALIVPFYQQGVLHCFKGRLCKHVSRELILLHLGQPRSFCTRCATWPCHSWLQNGHFHSAQKPLPANIFSGVLAVFSWSQYLVCLGDLVARELCRHSALPGQNGHLVPLVRLFTVACQTWGYPAGQLGHDHLIFKLLFGLTSMPPSRALLSGCHSRCSWGQS